MIYTVKYKRLNGFFWKTLRIKGDGFIESVPNGGITKDIRFFILEDESRVEIPVAGIIFKFLPDRFLVINQQVKKEAGKEL